MGALSFAKIFSVVLLSVIRVPVLDGQYFTDKREALRAAGCIAECEKNRTCRRQCFENDNRSFDGTIFGNEGPILSGPANFNATLHCKDVDVIKIRHNSGIWIIEENDYHDESWKNTGRIRVSDRMVSSFRNLTAGTSYMYKAHRMIDNGIISEPEISPSFLTFEMDHQPEKPSNVEIANQTLDDWNSFRIRADIIFQPASDRSCRYDVVSWNEDDGLTIAEFDSSQDFRFSLHNLDYASNVTVFVSARVTDNSESSDNTSLNFVTPSCLQMHRNLTFCAPDQVEGLRTSKIRKNGTNYEILVEWDHPAFVPDSYVLQCQCSNYESNNTSVITLPGNSTEILITVARTEIVKCQRVISIIAESPGGTSIQNWIYVDLHEIEDLFPKKDTTATDERAFLYANGITVASAIAFLTIVVAIVCVYHLWKYKIGTRNDRNGYSNYCQNLNGARKDIEISFYGNRKTSIDFENKYPLLPKDKFEIRPVRLTIKDVLGSGASGVVRLGRFKTDKNNLIDVAVKTLKDDPSAEDVKNFRQEISIMKSAGHHPNIVSIIGCCTHDVRRPLLIVEYCSRGDLQTYLRTLWQEIMSQALERRARCKITMSQNELRTTEDNEIENTVNVTSWIVDHQMAIANKLYDIQTGYINVPKDEDEVTAEDLLNFARQVACGMEFLSSNRIIHRDLAARNVLVCADKTVKISDFGLSRDIYQENVYKKQGTGRLPLKWMAIEALTHQIYTTKSDVWSFGILLWEIVTLGCNPYPETPTNMILQLLKSGRRMKKPDNCGDELYGIMRSCWHSRPRSRPNFTQLKNQLDRLLRTTTSHEHLNILREPAASPESTNHVDINNYSNIYSK